MIVSPSARVLFVHVQKTGGLTVEHLLRSALPDAYPVRGLRNARHASLGAALRAHPEFRDHFTFGFVRNPWARMYSWYAMIQRRQATAADGNAEVAKRIDSNPFWFRVMEDFPDFESFILRGTQEFRRLRTPQVQYLKAPGRKADFVGRTENLSQDVRHVFEHLGLPQPAELPHHNAGPVEGYREHFTPAMNQRIAELFAPDIRTYHYEF